MRLFNADGSRSEVSGNGVRGLAALLLRDDDAGRRRRSRSTPRRASSVWSAPDATGRGRRSARRWGCRSISARSTLTAGGRVAAGRGHELRQPAVRGRSGRCPTKTRFQPPRRRRSSGTRCFPSAPTSSSRTSKRPIAVRILIWERGVGPTHVVGDRIVRVAGRGRGVRRRGARRRRHRARRRAARRVARRQRLPDRLGRSPLSTASGCGRCRIAD